MCVKGGAGGRAGAGEGPKHRCGRGGEEGGRRVAQACCHACSYKLRACLGLDGQVV